MNQSHSPYTRKQGDFMYDLHGSSIGTWLGGLAICWDTDFFKELAVVLVLALLIVLCSLVCSRAGTCGSLRDL